MNILLVEDEEDLAHNIKKYLTQGKHEVFYAAHLSAAQDLIFDHIFDVVLLDLNLPDGNGLDLIEEVKEKNFSTGILIISARHAIDDRVKGLELGADDYLIKPFHLSELNARVNALSRRYNNSSNEGIVANEITINTQKQQVNVNKKIVNLTPKEYKLLYYFITNKNRVLTKSAICEYILGENTDWVDSFDLVYSHLKNVRKKLVQSGAKDYVKTIYGVGYIFEL